MRKVGIVCTIGPKVLNPEALTELHREGMSIIRLNGSHANLEWHAEAIKIIRKTLPNLPILLDIPGRKIRTIQLEFEPSFAEGDSIILTTDIAHNGREKVPVNYPELHLDLVEGCTIMADDGTLSFMVEKIVNQDIYCKANSKGTLKSRKGINVPFIKLNTPQVTDKDKAMIDFACKNGVDWVGISFVESAEHIQAFRKLISDRGPGIIAKVENQGGLDNVDLIAQEADGIMIDRGDLSVETNLIDVAIKQKKIILSANKYSTPVIVATELLHTMIENPFPTKAEISDISNAVIDGCAAVMLSGETAVGNYPIESIRLMAGVVDAAENYIDEIKYGGKFTTIENGFKINTLDIPMGIGKTIPILCELLPIDKIIVLTRSGYAAKIIAATGVRQEVIAVTDDEKRTRGLNLIYGVRGVYSEKLFSRNSTDHILSTLKMLWKKGDLSETDLIVIAGLNYPTKGSRMNAIQVFKIGDLISEYSWE